MEKIYNKKLIDKWVERSRLSESFHAERYDFFVIRYQQGEFLSKQDQAIINFQFVVRGSAVLYYLDEDGARRNVTMMENQGVLGDMEFVLGHTPIFYTEAVTPVTVLALPMEENRDRLEKDCEFLMYLLHQAARIKVFTSRSAVVLPKLEERLLYYLENDCPRQTMIGMENTAVKLQCSRRQLQRVVRKLEEQKRLVKRGRGSYQLQGEK